jgi:hypothetical protein
MSRKKNKKKEKKRKHTHTRTHSRSHRTRQHRRRAQCLIYGQKALISSHRTCLWSRRGGTKTAVSDCACEKKCAQGHFGSKFALPNSGKPAAPVLNRRPHLCLSPHCESCACNRFMHCLAPFSLHLCDLYWVPTLWRPCLVFFFIFLSFFLFFYFFSIFPGSFSLFAVCCARQHMHDTLRTLGCCLLLSFDVFSRGRACAAAVGCGRRTAAFSLFFSFFFFFFLLFLVRARFLPHVVLANACATHRARSYVACFYRLMQCRAVAHVLRRRGVTGGRPPFHCFFLFYFFSLFFFFCFFGCSGCRRCVFVDFGSPTSTAAKDPRLKFSFRS